MHPSRRSAANLNHSFLAATWVIAAVMPIDPYGMERSIRRVFKVVRASTGDDDRNTTHLVPALPWMG